MQQGLTNKQPISQKYFNISLKLEKEKCSHESIPKIIDISDTDNGRTISTDYLADTDTN